MQDVRLVVRMSDEVAELLARLAEREGLTVSAYVRRLLVLEGRKLKSAAKKVTR